MAHKTPHPLSTARSAPKSKGLYRRLIYVCGAVAAAFMFGIVLTGVLVEARQLWHEGATVFFSDAGMRLLIGACIAVLSAAPHLLLERASRQAGPPVLFLAASILMVSLQLLVTIKILFFTRGSTASIAVLFIPFYSLAFAVTVLVLAAFAKGFGLGRTSN